MKNLKKMQNKAFKINELVDPSAACREAIDLIDRALMAEQPESIEINGVKCRSRKWNDQTWILWNDWFAATERGFVNRDLPDGRKYVSLEEFEEHYRQFGGKPIKLGESLIF